MTSCGVETVCIVDALSSGTNSGYAGPSVEVESEDAVDAAEVTAYWVR